ncbi:hypothetical protein [Actinoallomurus soli]|uniref:hypothetical protein n=1 Tax=Actinoallomurus soli TaxID=2952535 RepID=UPI0020938EF5|nr:hypothetical protein [Actinoallomurus soli]MCO5968145.1 hypothetical protein [Actinoallomurus soli]
MSEAERAAVASVLRRWRSGGRLLTGYLVAMAPAFPLFAGWDHRFFDLVKASGLMTAGGVALLLLVGIRNGWAGDTLAEWRPELARPHELAGNPRLSGTGSLAYVAALVALTTFGLFVQSMTADIRATARGTAEVRSCAVSHDSRTGRVTTSTCRGTWVVAGRTYSGELPGGDTDIRYDPDDPATLGKRSLEGPVGLTLFLGVIAGGLAWRWITLARDPYIEELEMLTWQAARTRDR